MRLILCLSILSITAHTLSAADDLRSRISSLAQPLIERQAVVGLSIGVIRDDGELLLHYGETSPGDGRQPHDATIYEIGSIGKAFTGVLLADAVERGEVCLDDPVQQYLPDGVTFPTHGRLQITLLHLATHSSGLPRLPANLEPAEADNPYADYSLDRLYAFLSSAKLERRPGEAFAYSNLGMGLLGHVLERRTGKSYDALLAERITGGLGMTDTRITLTPEMRGLLATAHNADGEPVANWQIVTLTGAGGIHSTARDMLKFLAANIDADDAPLGRAIARSHEKQFPVDGAGLWIGLGWFIARDGVTRWHNGQTGGHTAWASFHRPSRTGVIVLANTGSRWIDTLGERIQQRLLGLNLPMPLPPLAINLPAEQLEAYTGTYALSPAFAITITRDGDKLYAQATLQQPLRIYPESQTSFFYKAVDAKLTFELGPDGLAKRLILHQNGRDMPGEKTTTKKDR